MGSLTSATIKPINNYKFTNPPKYSYKNNTMYIKNGNGDSNRNATRLVSSSSLTNSETLVSDEIHFYKNSHLSSLTFSDILRNDTIHNQIFVDTINFDNAYLGDWYNADSNTTAGRKIHSERTTQTPYYLGFGMSSDGKSIYESRTAFAETNSQTGKKYAGSNIVLNNNYELKFIFKDESGKTIEMQEGRSLDYDNVLQLIRNEVDTATGSNKENYTIEYIESEVSETTVVINHSTKYIYITSNSYLEVVS